MKKAAQRLALFFVITQVDRVAGYIHLFQPADNAFYVWLSYGIAVGLALGVYTSFFYVRQPKAKWASIAGILLFGGFDLLFNELALIRTASMKQLISSTSSFVWIPAEYLQVAIQASVLAYGILPTLASAVLGWIQGGADKMTDAEFGRITIWQRFGRSITKVFDTITVRFAMGFEATATKLGGVDGVSSTDSPVIDGQITPVAVKKRWPELSRDDVAFISVNNRDAIKARFGVSDGAAGKWKADVKSGIMPWQSAKRLPENAEK